MIAIVRRQAKRSIHFSQVIIIIAKRFTTIGWVTRMTCCRTTSTIWTARPHARWQRSGTPASTAVKAKVCLVMVCS